MGSIKTSASMGSSTKETSLEDIPYRLIRSASEYALFFKKGFSKGNICPR